MTHPDPADDPTSAASQLDAGAHAMRNDIATLRAASRIVDDSEIADAIESAAVDLQRRIEQMVTAARIELGRRPDLVTIDAAELLRLGTARARREGRPEPTVVLHVNAGPVDVPGIWAERLVADVLHDADSAWLSRLAAACNATLSDEPDGAVRLSFQHAGER